MRSWISTVTAAAALVVLAGVAVPARAADPVVGSWIVTMAPGTDVAARAAALVGTAGGTLGHVFTNVLGGFSFSGSSVQADLIRRSTGVRSVVADGAVRLADALLLDGAQLVPTGVARVDGPAALASGSTGAGVTVAVIDSGIDPAHPDLSARLHPTLGTNCVNPLVPPLDDNTHGTHVAGIIAASDDGIGIVGVAPGAQLVPVKAFDASGDSTWSVVICGIDYVAAHADEIDVANMSFGDLGNGAVTACDGVTTSDIDALRQSICDLSATGVVPVAAAGNNMIDVAGFVPAVFPETIAVSALSDLDGEPGGAGGCLVLVLDLVCDDEFAYLFSNFGDRIDVMAPGLEILSTIPGGYEMKDGTSMAAPHVAGVVALMLQADPTLGTAGARSILRRSGECPDGNTAGADAACVGQGFWTSDPDGNAEPLVHAARAAALAAARPPTATVTSPVTGTTVSGTTLIAVTATDESDATGSLAVAVRVDSGAWMPAPWNATTSRYERTWATGLVGNGGHTIAATATDGSGLTGAAPTVAVTVANLMHIGDLDASKSVSKQGWKARVTVTVHGAGEALLSGATVTAAWSGGASGSGTCTTSRKGTCDLTSALLAKTVSGATLRVTNVARSGQTYTQGTNHDPDGSSDGTVIVVAQ